MSWGIEITGTKEGAAKKVAESFDKMAANYAGKEEGKDIIAAKDRILALIDACDLTTDPYGMGWNAVNVKASGSHGWTDKGLTTASMQINVTRVVLAL
jgi:hypothetical protein